MDTNETKIFSFRVPLTVYFETIQKAANKKMSISEYLFSIFFADLQKIKEGENKKESEQIKFLKDKQKNYEKQQQQL